MKIIAHRANLNGPDTVTENKPESIEHAIDLGFDCEIDVWFVNGVFMLGHDFPETIVSIEFLTKFHDFLWIHCKNIDALLCLKDNFNCFYHDKDTYTITTLGNIWGNIGSPMNKDIIQVMPEKASVFSYECAGICTDYPFRYRDIYLNE